MSGPVILNRQRRRRIAVSRLQQFARRLARRLRIGNESFTIVLASDRAIRQLNRDFRRKDTPTDVLSFPCEPQSPGAIESGLHPGLPGHALGGAGAWDRCPPAHACFLPETKRARERAFHHSVRHFQLHPEGPPHLDKHSLGDMILSVETARRQALARNHGLERELCILVIHGLLHLLGYDHEVDRGQMRRKELKLQRELL
ncbi:MAG: rRNA maturation RNase YbeY [Acidobacteriales bacterium]|nr:rRNA maturation RNase YbeY [Terriglobales bacterium]